MFIKLVGAVLVALFISLTAICAIGLGVAIATAYTIFIGTLYAIGGYVFGMIISYLFPVSVSAITSWAGLTISVPLLFATINLGAFWLNQVYNTSQNKDNITAIFNRYKEKAQQAK